MAYQPRVTVPKNRQNKLAMSGRRHGVFVLRVDELIEARCGDEQGEVSHAHNTYTGGGDRENTGKNRESWS